MKFTIRQQLRKWSLLGLMGIVYFSPAGISIWMNSKFRDLGEGSFRRTNWNTNDFV